MTPRLRIAVWLTLLGLAATGIFLALGFTPVSFGILFLVGAPALLAGMVLFLWEVIRDLRSRRIL